MDKKDVLFRKLAIWGDGRPPSESQIRGQELLKESLQAVPGCCVQSSKSAPPVILKLVSAISIVLSALNLQFQGQFFPIFLRPVPGIVQATDSVPPKMEQLMSWLQSGHHAVSFFPLVVVLVSAKQLRNVHQTLLSMSFREELKIL